MLKILTGLCLIAANIFPQNTGSINLAAKIADRIINETAFKFTEAEQKPTADLQVIDFTKPFNDNRHYSFAAARISVNDDRKLLFGIGCSASINIYINKKLIYTGNSQPGYEFREISYSMFNFRDTVNVSLKKGLNEIVITANPKEKTVVFLREITAAEKNPESTFLPVKKDIKKYTWPWCFCNPERMIHTLHPDSLFNLIELNKVSCDVIEPDLVKKLVIKSNSIFKKDSFADWNYPNGILMMSLTNLTKATANDSYGKFVKKYCDFIKSNLPQFKKQYYENHDFRGPFYRVFRKCMLDDAGSPVLPFAEIELDNRSKDYESLITEMADYIINHQARLNDGTFCRPEPEEWTVWADDLFMSVPLLVRLGKLFNDEKYFDEASKQLINFRKYLYDDEAELYKHGWFSRTNQKSDIFWGRANGWVIWATSEALKFMPKNSKYYNLIAKNFVRHLNGILNTQDNDGMWHQVLNDKNSFEETSCSAMFIIGLSRGIKSGLLDKRIANNVFKAWKAIQNKIDSKGTVKDICCGTGIGPDKKFYESRKRYDNDPRGLGAVITAAIEVDNLKKYLDSQK